MQKSKKLLIIIPYFIPAYWYGWPIKVAYDQAIELLKKWYDVTVVTTDALDDQNRVKKLIETIDGIKIIRFRNLFNKLAKFHNGYLPFTMKFWLKKNIKNYNIVHIHDILNLPAIWWSKYASKNNVKYFLHPHGILSDTRIQSRKKTIKRIFLKFFKSMLDKANCIFALTKQEEKEVKKYTKNTHIYILPNGVDIKEFEDPPDIDLRKKYWLDKDVIMFSFLGRIQYIKWLDIAFELLAEYNKTNTNWRYLIIWPDEWEKQKLQDLAKKLDIENNIIWYGVSTWKEKYGLLQSSDVFLFTSRAEWFPMTILEALWCNIPVYISTWCNLPEAQEIVGKVITNWDKKNVDLLSDIISYKTKYIKNIPSFLKKYDIKVLVDNLISKYEK